MVLYERDVSSETVAEAWAGSAFKSNPRKNIIKIYNPPYKFCNSINLL